MPTLDDHRKTAGSNVEIFSLRPPFSFFDFIEDRFGDYDSIRRIFSLSRSSHARTLVLESIPACGLISEENEDIKSLYPGYLNDKLLRISFWQQDICAVEDIETTADTLIGYAILKRDVIPEISHNKWHIFEAVFLKYAHDHNCVPRPRTYNLMVGEQLFTIQGILYCQQNELNKACAQVAVRSLLSRLLPEKDVSYRRINEIARSVSPAFSPENGLNVVQIRAILSEYDLRFTDIDYSQDNELRDVLPFQKYAYGGLEAGGGALVGFRFSGRELRHEARHIIPIFGHTFNKDTWAPNADYSYFRIGESVGYVPSESWTSSFLGHDDNFGPNFCVPRLYIEKNQVDYIVEIFRPGAMYGGVQAEAMALNILYSILPTLTHNANKWIRRLLEWTSKQQVVFRAQTLTPDEYVAHLKNLDDWEGNKEESDLCDFLALEMPQLIWAVEVSTPHLFPANERKLGEIVFDATQILDTQDDNSINKVFIFARLPETYLFGGDVSDGTPSFTPVPSKLVSHTDLIRM